MQNDDDEEKPAERKRVKYADQYVYVVTAVRPDMGFGNTVENVGVFNKATDAYGAALEFSAGEYASGFPSMCEECEECKGENDPCEECAYVRVIASVMDADTEDEMRSRFDNEWQTAHAEFEKDTNRVKWTVIVEKTIVI